MWRQNGFVRLAMVFTSDAAQTFGMTAYDLVQQLRSGKLGRAFSTLTALALTGILMKAASEGLPDDEDDEDGDEADDDGHEGDGGAKNHVADRLREGEASAVTDDAADQADDDRLRQE